MGTVEGRGIMVDVDVAVIMRDGAVLRADVHRPAAGGPFPALVHRSAYGKQNAPMVSGLVADPKVLAAAGFAVVVQDVRGRFASEGEWAPFVHEMDDGYDTVEWAASQPWCTGEVGCYGSSYMGITTHLAVAAKPPHLRAAAVLVASRDPNDGLLRTGGAFEQGFLTRWALNNAADTVSRLDLDPTDAADLASCAALAASDPWSVIADLPVRDAELLAAVAPYWREWIDRPPGDGHWARTWGLPAQVGVPLLSVVGFRDWMQPSMLGLFDPGRPAPPGGWSVDAPVGLRRPHRRAGLDRRRSGWSGRLRSVAAGLVFPLDGRSRGSRVPGAGATRASGPLLRHRGGPLDGRPTVAAAGAGPGALAGGRGPPRARRGRARGAADVLLRPG
jgi:predicted acyl esterase